MIRCLPLYGRNQKIEKSKEKKQVRREEKPNEKVIKELVPKRFWKWEKVFGKAKLKKMPVQKV